MERELIRSAQAGDEEAWEILYQTYQSRVYHLCFSIVRDEELAQDLVQETFVRAYTHINTFRFEASLYTWLWRIAYNLSLNMQKKRKRASEVELKPELCTQEKEEFDLDFLDLLDEKHRVVFELFAVQKLKQKEIAELLHVPHGTVRSRIFYAKKKLRDAIREKS